MIPADRRPVLSPSWHPSTPAPLAPFSAQEMSRRRAAVLEAAAEAGCDQVIAYGSQRAGSAVPWLTRWPVTREAVAIVGADRPLDLVVQFHNHVALAADMASDCRVHWGGLSTVDTVIDLLRERGGDHQRVGLIGEVPYQVRDALVSVFGPTVDLSGAYEGLRSIKSEEEIQHLRVGARLSDAALHALATGLLPGATDRELLDRMERAYVPHGGTTHIHYLSLTPMQEPRRYVPAQFPTGEQVEIGTIAVTEISAAYRGYAGQVLRTLSVGAPLDARHQELHAVAQAAFDAIVARLRPGAVVAEIREAAQVIPDAGFELCDDLLHGFGGGYLAPVLGRFGEPDPEFTFRSGMTVVVQPNVVTVDRQAGVQTGELLLITDDGATSLHDAPPGPYLVHP